jgi:hypothetical protein
VSPATGMETGSSVVRLQTSRTAVHLRHQCTHRSLTTINAPMDARTPTPTPTHRHFSGRRPKTLLLRPCCCAAVRSLQLRGATSVPAVEGDSRGCGSAASGKLCLALALGARAGWNAIYLRPESPSFPATGMRGRSRSRDIGGQEWSRAQPRRPEHHRSPTTS